jgi:hypothetical protein
MSWVAACQVQGTLIAVEPLDSIWVEAQRSVQEGRNWVNCSVRSGRNKCTLCRWMACSAGSFPLVSQSLIKPEFTKCTLISHEQEGSCWWPPGCVTPLCYRRSP